MDYYDEIHSDEMHKRDRLDPIYTKDITAQEAKERADAFLQAKENDDFKNIMYLIRDAADSGKYKIYLDKECNISVTGVIKDKLEQLGYKVELQSIQDFRRIVISWKGEKEYVQ